MIVREDVILQIVRASHPSHLGKFDLDALLNDRFLGQRKIDLQAGEKEHTYPGRYLQVMDMASGRALAWWEEGMHDYSIIHAYLIGKEGASARYAKDLFSPDVKRESEF